MTNNDQNPYRDPENGEAIEGNLANDKNVLSQEDIINNVNTFEDKHDQHMALETKEGKNSGAIPAAFKNQRSNHP